MKPKISFLIATKDRGDIIRDTIDSLITQKNPSWEAIIVDDHGTDNTEAIINSYEDERLRYYKLSDAHGMGASCARNFASMHANSSIVAILDSDDICYPNRVDVTSETFDKNSNADVFYANFDIWEESSGVIRDRKTPYTEFNLEKLKENNFIPHPTVAMKKEVLQNNPYNSYFKLVEDYELMTRLAVSGKKFISSPEKILKYRISESNISIGKDKKEYLENYSQMARKIRGWKIEISDPAQKLYGLEEIE